MEARDETERKCVLSPGAYLWSDFKVFLAECLYLKGLPEESRHLAGNSDGSQITAAGVGVGSGGLEYFAVSKKKDAWIGSSWQPG